MEADQAEAVTNSVGTAMNDLQLPMEAIRQATEAGAFEGLAAPIQIALFMGALAFLSTLLVSVTSFTRIVIVLSFVRRAMTTQEIPPTISLIGLAIFMTAFTMGPTLDAIKDKALRPYVDEEITGVAAVQICSDELRVFMLQHTRKADLALFMNMARVESIATPEETPIRVLIPAYIISEFKTAFIMGFCIYVPFVLIDLVVSTILMSLGMMMMPPVVVSAPIKLLIFVVVDGWHLVAQGLGMSFMQ